MFSLSMIARKFLQPDIHAQVKAGYLTEDLKLTDAGQLALLQAFYFATGSALLTDMANDKLAREAANK